MFRGYFTGSCSMHDVVSCFLEGAVVGTSVSLTRHFRLNMLGVVRKDKTQSELREEYLSRYRNSRPRGIATIKQDQKDAKLDEL